MFFYRRVVNYGLHGECVELVFQSLSIQLQGRSTFRPDVDHDARSVVIGTARQRNSREPVILGHVVDDSPAGSVKANYRHLLRFHRLPQWLENCPRPSPAPLPIPGPKLSAVYVHAAIAGIVDVKAINERALQDFDIVSPGDEPSNVRPRSGDEISAEPTRPAIARSCPIS